MPATTPRTAPAGSSEEAAMSLFSVDVENATLVHIAAKPLANDPKYTYVISMFPKRHGETAAFDSADPAKRSPERPQEVVWVGHGLAPDMKILIVAKNAGQGHMNKDLYELTAANPVASSAKVKLNGKNGAHWTYGIRLVDQSNKDLADPIDPDVIIHPDP
jgi:hypothetical protein